MVEIIGMINLDYLGQDSLKIHNELSELRRDHYQPHEKILVNYTDQDYFYYNCPLGFVLHNFLSILYHVDISLSQIVFFTTNTNLEQAIKFFLSDANDQPEIHVLLVSKMTYRNIRGLLNAGPPPPKQLTHKALCMMGTHREHRLMLHKYLKANNLLDHVQVSVNNPNAGLSLIGHPPPAVSQNVCSLESVSLVYSFPPMTVEHWDKPISNSELRKIADVSVPSQVVNPNIPAHGHNFYQHYAVDIVTETNFHYPSQFVSEKTLRPLLLKTPFLIFGPANFLSYLHSRGFETFSDIWDESYDQITDPQERFVACCKLVNVVASWSIDDWVSIYQHIAERLDRNRNTLLQYIENDLTPLATEFNYPLE